MERLLLDFGILTAPLPSQRLFYFKQFCLHDIDIIFPTLFISNFAYAAISAL